MDRGIVKRTENGFAFIEMELNSSCRYCSNKGVCMAGDTPAELRIENPEGLKAGDIVTVAVFTEKSSDGQASSPQVIMYPELTGLETYSVENAKTQDTAEIREQQKDSQSGNSDPVARAVTLIVTEAQAEILIQAEYTGKLHLIFEKRGANHE